MRAGTNAAWDGNWDQAIVVYRRALAEFPDDVSALIGLGSAYSGAGQLEAALKAYQRAIALAPDDPVLLERIGKTREQPLTWRWYAGKMPLVPIPIACQPTRSCSSIISATVRCVRQSGNV